MIKTWKARIPFKFPDGRRMVFKFMVQAYSRDQAHQLAFAVIQKKCPIEPDVNDLKMVRA